MTSTTLEYFRKGDKYLSHFICAYYFFQSLNGLIHTLGLTGVAWTLFSKGILAIFLLLALIVITKRKSMTLWGTELFWGTLLLLSFFLGNIDDHFSSIAFNLVLVYLPLFLACVCIKDVRVLLEEFYYIIWPTELLCVVDIIINTDVTYSMSAGYTLLVPLLIHLDKFFSSNRIIDLIMSIIDFAFIVGFASRGPILCVGVYLVIKIVLDNSISRRKKISFVIVLSALTVLLVLNYSTILEWAIRLLDKLGRSSRTLRMISANMISYSSSRSYIFHYYLDKVFESPFIGKGLASSWTVSSYPHNLIIEIWLAFGLPIGTIILLAIVLILFKGFTVKDSNQRRLIHVFFADILMLLWSGSFLMSAPFFMAMGLCLQETQRNEND